MSAGAAAVSITPPCFESWEDLDADGQQDEGETDPNNADTDGGGADDGTEVLVDGTDPLDPTDDIVDVDRSGVVVRGGKLFGCASTGQGSAPAAALLFLAVLLGLRGRRKTGR